MVALLGPVVASLFLVLGKLLATLDNVVGVVVPFGPFTEVITSLAGTSVPVPSAFSKNLSSSFPVSGFLTILGYTFVPSFFV